MHFNQHDTNCGAYQTLTRALPPRRRLRLLWMPADLSTARPRSGRCPFSGLCRVGCRLLVTRPVDGLLPSPSGEPGVRYAGSLLRRSQDSIFGRYSSWCRSDARSPARPARTLGSNQAGLTSAASQRQVLPPVLRCCTKARVA